MSDHVSQDSEDPMSDYDANSSDLSADDNLPSEHLGERLDANRQTMQSSEGELHSKRNGPYAEHP